MQTFLLCAACEQHGYNPDQNQMAEMCEQEYSVFKE